MVIFVVSAVHETAKVAVMTGNLLTNIPISLRLSCAPAETDAGQPHDPERKKRAASLPE
jgi:hypothetical protein